MTLSPKTLLITGATGKQGGAVISALLEDEKSSAFKIIAVTRNRQSQSAQLASKPNVSVIEGDISDPDALFDQAGAVWGVFAVQVNSDAELEQGKALVTAAAARGVSFFRLCIWGRQKGPPWIPHSSKTSAQSITLRSTWRSSCSPVPITCLT